MRKRRASAVVLVIALLAATPAWGAMEGPGSGESWMETLRARVFEAGSWLLSLGRASETSELGPATDPNGSDLGPWTDPDGLESGPEGELGPVPDPDG